MPRMMLSTEKGKNQLKMDRASCTTCSQAKESDVSWSATGKNPAIPDISEANRFTKKPVIIAIPDAQNARRTRTKRAKTKAKREPQE